MRAVPWHLALVLVLSFSGVATAQTPHVYAEASGLISTQGSTPSGEFGGTGVGGTSIGVAGAFGVELSPHFLLVAEVGFPAQVEVVQDFAHFLIWRTDDLYRDLTVSELLHVKIGSLRIATEIVGGVSFVHQELTERTAQGGDEFSTNPAPLGPYGAWQSHSAWTLGLVMGGDVPIRVREHFAVVPQLRMFIIQRGLNDFAGIATLGLGTVVIRPAIGGRWIF